MLRALSLLAAAVLAPLAASAAPVRLDAPAEVYVRARAAAADGNLAAASAGFTTLLAQDPGSPLLAERAYRQGVVGGDAALAVRAARLLDRLGRLPPDANLLLALEALRTRDWAGVRTRAERLDKDKVFAFLAPYVRAWTAVASRQGDPLALVETARTIPLAQAYLPEQRALLLLALGRTEEGVAALRGPGASSLDRLSAHTRLVLADALAGSGQKERALGLLTGDDPLLAGARARIAAGKRLPQRIDGPGEGLASLLVAVGADLGRQQLAPIALTIGRFATFIAPQDAGGWVFVAQLLGNGRQRPAALAALDHVAPDDPFAPLGQSLRIAILTQQGDKAAALDDARRAAERGDADPAAWSRLGDVYLSLDQPAQAVDAYRRALDRADALKAPPDRRWPLLLQLAEALDESGDWPGARAALAQAYTLAPDHPLVLNQLGYSEIAHREDVARASGLIERASKLRPDDAAITDSLGWSYYLRGDAAKALPLLEKAVTTSPAEPTINEHLGDVYWANGRLYEARYAWRAALVTAEDKDKGRLTAKIDAGLTPATASP